MVSIFIYVGCFSICHFSNFFILFSLLCVANKQKKRSSNKVTGFQATVNVVLDWVDSVVFQPILSWLRAVVLTAGVGFSVSRVSEATSAPINTNGKVVPAVDFGRTNST